MHFTCVQRIAQGSREAKLAGNRDACLFLLAPLDACGMVGVLCVYKYTILQHTLARTHACSSGDGGGQLNARPGWIVQQAGVAARRNLQQERKKLNMQGNKHCYFHHQANGPGRLEGEVEDKAAPRLWAANKPNLDQRPVSFPSGMDVTRATSPLLYRVPNFVEKRGFSLAAAAEKREREREKKTERH